MKRKLSENDPHDANVSNDPNDENEPNEPNGPNDLNEPNDTIVTAPSNEPPNYLNETEWSNRPPTRPLSPRNTSYQENKHYTDIFGDRATQDQLEHQSTRFTPREWQNLHTKLFVQNFDVVRAQEQELYVRLQLMEQMFCYGMSPRQDARVYDRTLILFPNTCQMEQDFKHQMSVYQSLQTEMDRRNLMNTDTREGREVLFKLRRIAMTMNNFYSLAGNMRIIENSKDSITQNQLMHMHPNMMFDNKADFLKLKKPQQVEDFLRKKAFYSQLRRKQDALYQPRKNAQGEWVHSFEYLMDISEFVYRSVFPLSHNRYWFDCLTGSPATANTVIGNLTKYHTEYIPELKPNPNFHAFQNGLFNLENGQFYGFREEKGKKSVSELRVGHVDLIAIKYHDLAYREDEMNNEIHRVKAEEKIENDNHPPEYWLPIPGVDEILQGQGFDREERWWIFCLLGRMLWELGKKDHWEVMPVFYGQGNSGKSSALRLLASLLEKQDVGILGNTTQRDFSLESLVDKMMIIALDIDKSFNFDQMLLQSMISGEDVAINRKFKTALAKVWTIPLAFAGNMLPKWQDNAGSMARRLVIIHFRKRVAKINTDLYRICQMNKDRFLRAITAAYLDITSRFPNASFMDIMPKSFKEAGDKLMRELNALQDFIEECCDIDPAGTNGEARKCRCTFTDFNKYWSIFCKERNLPRQTLNTQYTNGNWAKYGLDTLPSHSSFPSGGKVIMGANVKLECRERWDKMAYGR